MTRNLEKEEVERLLALTKFTSADEILLGRFFDSFRIAPAEKEITTQELRWIAANMEANPEWRKHWARLEQNTGSTVDWKIGIRQESRPRVLHLLTEYPVLKYAVAAGLGFAFLYGGLFSASRLMLSDRFLLASVDEYRYVLRQETRGGHPEEVTVHQQGIEELAGAATSYIGLFPHYDTESAHRGILLLQASYAAGEDPFNKAEAAFFLAKGYLMTGDIPSAKSWLKEVLEGEIEEYQTDAAILMAGISDAELQ